MIDDIASHEIRAPANQDSILENSTKRERERERERESDSEKESVL